MERQNIAINFFVIEGLDGAGTTTQLEMIQQRAAENDTRIVCTFEPTDNPVGQLIRQILEKKISVDPQTLPYLFAADRHEHIHGKSGIISRLTEGHVVVSDRYLFSSLAYQSITGNIDQISRLNSTFPLPEAVFYLDVPAEVCETRMENRKSRDLFEQRTIQEQVRQGYHAAFSRFADSGMEIIIIDGALPPEKIHANIWKRIHRMPINK